MKKLIYIVITCSILSSCAHHDKSKENIKILPVSNVNWEKLNPARGDKSPQAGTLWGDRKGNSATGFLAKFVDGFSSPPHIHNVSYKAIVIEGFVHNDDPKAAIMWMPKGSYWTQPAGEAHITSAKGKSNIALVEIDNGPYLVRPIKNKFDNGERPINIHASNIIWRNQGRYQLAELWQNKDGIVTGTLLRFSSDIKIKMSKAKLVLVGGRIMTKEQALNPGSLVSVDDTAAIKFTCKVDECIVYLKSEKKILVH